MFVLISVLVWIQWWWIRQNRSG